MVNRKRTKWGNIAPYESSLRWWVIWKKVVGTKLFKYISGKFNWVYKGFFSFPYYPLLILLGYYYPLLTLYPKKKHFFFSPSRSNWKEINIQVQRASPSQLCVLGVVSNSGAPGQRLPEWRGVRFYCWRTVYFLLAGKMGSGIQSSPLGNECGRWPTDVCLHLQKRACLRQPVPCSSAGESRIHWVCDLQGTQFLFWSHLWNKMGYWDKSDPSLISSFPLPVGGS